MERSEVVRELTKYGIRDIREYRKDYFEVSVAEGDSLRVTNLYTLESLIKMTWKNIRVLDKITTRRNNFSSRNWSRHVGCMEYNAFEEENWIVRFTFDLK